MEQFATFAYVSAARKFIKNSSHGINNAQVLAMLEYGEELQEILEQLQVGKSNYSKKLCISTADTTAATLTT